MTLSALDYERAWAAVQSGVLPTGAAPLPTDTGTPVGPVPNPAKPAGYADPSLPFEHVVVIMQENHSFDNYFGMLPVRGKPQADGFTFAPGSKTPLNENPANTSGGYLRSFQLEGTCQPGGVSQAWQPTHDQTNLGRMNGFVMNSAGGGSGTPAAMGYWDQADIPYYYDLALNFTIGNRSFCATQGQTYPNRRFLYAGTASGMVSTSMDTFMTSVVPYPSGGTIFDTMSANGVSWKSYFTDLPTVAIIPETIEKYGSQFQPMSQLLVDLQAPATATTGLPSVSFVDTEMGVADEVGGNLQTYFAMAPAIPGVSPAVRSGIADARDENGDEENPADIALGEMQVSVIINAIMASSYWSKTLIILTYDEHGGYYDHVPPISIAAPDSITPNAEAGNKFDGYNTSGVRIPTMVISPWSTGGVSNVAHDHTAIIKTIATKWNLPALTLRDRAAPDLFSYVDFTNPQYATPPALAAPAGLALASNSCQTTFTEPPVTADDGFFANQQATPVPEVSLPVLLPMAGAVGALATVLARHNREARHAAAVGLAEREGLAPPALT